MKAKVIVRAKLNPTEDESKLMRAIVNLTGFENYRKEHEGNFEYIIQEGDESLLIRLRELLRRERILDAARRVIMQGVEGQTITFHLNRQVAYVGHISFCKPEGESPLGPITFHIWTENVKELIDWLATRTIGGVPVDELCPSEYRPYAQLEKPSK
ncbi:MAG: hypothetical protein N3D72_03200 [Candidatus Methanomethyliaceae archaeon]|nr:hypothetical protein [Candidatus Methanomethyliaceae archaeon]